MPSDKYVNLTRPENGWGQEITDQSVECPPTDHNYQIIESRVNEVMNQRTVTVVSHCRLCGKITSQDRTFKIDLNIAIS